MVIFRTPSGGEFGRGGCTSECLAGQPYTITRTRDGDGGAEENGRLRLITQFHPPLPSAVAEERPCDTNEQAFLVQE